jgi:flagellar biosynthesis/type III secretory pathway M-ring protein FliF/YscJ
MEKNKELIKTGTKYGLLALAALLLIVFVIRPAKRAIRSAAMAAATHLLPAAPAPTLALPGGQMMSSQTQQFQSPEQRRLDTSRSVGADGGKTVAEMEAEMDAQIARELNSPVQEIKRARALQKQLVEKSKSEPQLIAMTLRGWLQDGK